MANNYINIVLFFSVYIWFTLIVYTSGVKYIDREITLIRTKILLLLSIIIVILLPLVLEV